MRAMAIAIAPFRPCAVRARLTGSSCCLTLPMRCLWRAKAVGPLLHWTVLAPPCPGLVRLYLPPTSRSTPYAVRLIVDRVFRADFRIPALVHHGPQ